MDRRSFELRAAEGVKTRDQLSRPGRRIFCAELQLTSGRCIKVPHSLQRQRTIEPDRSLDDACGELAFVSFAGVYGIDQNVRVKRSALMQFASSPAGFARGVSGAGACELEKCANSAFLFLRAAMHSASFAGWNNFHGRLAVSEHDHTFSRLLYFPY